MYRKLAVIACAAALTMLTVVAAQAQDAPDPATLEYVTTAFDNTLSLTSLHIESQSQTEGSGGQGFSFAQNQTGIFDLAQAGDAWNARGTRTTRLTLPFGDIEIAVEMIVLDGKTYLRFGEIPEQMAQFIQVPQGWFDAVEQPELGQGLPGVSSDDPSAIVLSVLDALKLPVSNASVTTLSDLPADVIDGKAMRVIQMTVNPQQVLDSEAAGLLQGGAGGFLGGQPGQNGAVPAELPDPSTLQPIKPEDVQITFAVYIGEDEQLIHRIYSVIVISPSTASAGTSASTITTITNFSKFGETVTIAAPELDS